MVECKARVRLPCCVERSACAVGHSGFSSFHVHRYALIRRVALDLTGLPPTLEQVDQFVNDAAPDAYERLDDGLLNEPSYGEHWARLWLDLARSADSASYADDPPLQAPVTLHDPVYVEAVQALARRMTAAGPTVAERVIHGFRLCLARPPDADLIDLAAGTVVANVLLNLDEMLMKR